MSGGWVDDTGRQDTLEAPGIYIYLQFLWGRDLYGMITCAHKLKESSRHFLINEGSNNNKNKLLECVWTFLRKFFFFDFSRDITSWGHGGKLLGRMTRNPSVFYVTRKGIHPLIISRGCLEANPPRDWHSQSHPTRSHKSCQSELIACCCLALQCIHVIASSTWRNGAKYLRKYHKIPEIHPLHSSHYESRTRHKRISPNPSWDPLMRDMPAILWAVYVGMTNKIPRWEFTKIIHTSCWRRHHQSVPQCYPFSAAIYVSQSHHQQ